MGIKKVIQLALKASYLIIAGLLLYMCLSIIPLRMFAPMALIPAYFAFVPAKRAMASLLKLLMIAVIWISLMYAANGDKINDNFKQGYEKLKEFSEKAKLSENLSRGV